MNISIKSYREPQYSFTSRVHSREMSAVMKTLDCQSGGSNVTLLALNANLRALKARIGSEVAKSITNALYGKLNTSELANRNVSNVKGAVDNCIYEIISKDELQNNPELRATVLKLKADTLQDIANMVRIIK